MYGREATGSNQDKVQLWRVSDGSLLHTIKYRSFIDRSIESVAFSPDGTLLATAKLRGPVRLFDVQQMLR
jgi:WD40 repeat protein